MGRIFDTAYNTLLDRWPQPLAGHQINTRIGSTRVHSSGEPDKPAIMLIGGGGACSPAWAEIAARLVMTHHVFALDVPGDAGMSPPPTHKPRDTAEVALWLEDVLDGLGLDHVFMVGHSYGAWLALTHAVHQPQRVEHLVLLDPTDCFVQLAPTYLIHALPLFLAPSASRHRAFLMWETAGRGLNPDATNLYSDQGRPAVLIRPSLPRPQELGELRMPVSVLVAESSRAHDVAALAEQAKTRIPKVEISTLHGVSHHAIPTERPDQLAAQLLKTVAGHG